MPHRSRSAQQTVDVRSRSFWIALIAAAVALVLFGIAGSRAVRLNADSRADGWSEIRRDGVWRVEGVDGSGPAAGLLQPGDRVNAVNGDARAARVGGLWFVKGVEAGSAYTIQVLRDQRSMAIPLAVRLHHQPYLARVLTFLAIAATFFVVAVVMAVAQPRNRTVQYGVASSLLSALFLVWTATRPDDGVQRDAVSVLLGLTFPLQLMTGLLFFEAFPHRVAASRTWKTVIRLLLAIGTVVFVARAWVVVLRLLPAVAASAALDRSLAFVSAYQSVGQLIENAYSASALVTQFLLLVRNYRLLSSQGERRRVQIVLWSQAMVLVGMALIGAGIVVVQAIGVASRDSAAVANWILAANGFLVIMPVSFGYAIVKHRVLGIRVFIRLGIQYLLAQNVLRAAVALPALVVAYSVVSHPDRTIGEALQAAWSSGQVALLGVAAIGLRFRAPLAATIDRRFFRAAYDQEAILLRLVNSIKQLDSLAEISAMISREVDAALHVAGIRVFYRSPETRDLQLGFSSLADGREPSLSADSSLLAEVGRAPQARTRTELLGLISDGEEEWLDRLNVELVVPITGIDRNVCGLMLIGEKRSEEPFTGKDRNLLQMIAAQVSAVYEILNLREQVGQHHRIQNEVLARLERQQINVVRECPRCGLCCDSTVDRCPDDGTALVPSLPVDRTLDGKYRLERLVGRGGMGAVYQATDLRLNRVVAVKVVRSTTLSSGAMQRRFAREAQACGRLTHANIVRVYDYGVAGETAYLVMEYVRGVTLRAELDRVGSLRPARAATVLDQALDGMEAAHRAGVLHRDLKPENLLVRSLDTGDGDAVKILDFGLAKIREANFIDPKSLTVAGVVMGTFGYMSPEQLYGEQVDERTDVYSLGVIALETITGRLMLEGRFFHETIARELTQRLVVSPVAEHQRLAEILRRALAPKAAERFASVSDMRGALIPALRACPDVPLNAAPPRPAISSDPDALTAAGSSAADVVDADHPTEPPRMRT
jgi:serine/threonine protein kinase